jgi:glutamate-1-semialdehyde 2,1-aminomutase
VNAYPIAVDRSRLTPLLSAERQRFEALHPRSREFFTIASQTLLRGVPMSWMSEWHGGFPIFLAQAQGAMLTDVDGITYADFCLGDTGALAGHAPGAVSSAVESRYRRGATAMLPTEDAGWVGAELKRRFGLPVWQFSLTATDANRWMLRLARELSGRRRILVFHGCYHGTVDETVITLDAEGLARSRPGNIGAAVDPRTTTDVVEFNDLTALERCLGSRQIACVLTEPALTNAGGIVLPDPGFHDGLRELTRQTGTYLALDETQTFPNGPGGYTGEHGLTPDFLTIGKAIAGGLPIGAYGMQRPIADAIIERRIDMGDIGAVGGTLAGNALSLAAARATLGDVLTDAAHHRMNSLADRFRQGVEEVIATRRLPWHIVQIGSRLEYRYAPVPPRNARQALSAVDAELDAFLHLYLLNRGVLLTPFHNMALISPATDEAQVDAHTTIFGGAIDALIGTAA